MASEELRKFRLRRAKALAARKAKLPEFAKKADDLQAIKESVDSAATVSGALWLSYLFVTFYIAVAAGAVTHEDLLLQRPVRLPFLNVELPLLAFFFLAPILFVATHVYTIVHFNMLGQKAARFHAELHHQLGDEKEIRDKLRRLLPSNVLVQIFAGPPELRDGRFGFILKAIVVLTLVACPVLLLLLLQIQFLPHHTGWITWTQRIALIFDIAILWILRPPTLLNGVGGWSFHGGEAETAARRVGAMRVAGLASTGVLSLLAIWFSVVVATIPGEWQENYFISTRERLFAGNVDTVTRRRKSLFSNTLVLPGFDIYVALKVDDRTKLDWKDHLIDLRGRALDWAVFSGAKLPRADLTGAQLQSAWLLGAQLQGASLDGAQLQGASLDNAQLQGASLDGAQLQGASLYNAQLQGAPLHNMQLQGASLDWAKLQGASLDRVELQGASLDNAQLQGASLDRVELQGASLDNAQLQGASLDGAQLQGASLYNAQLQGASLQNAQLQGASLEGAYLWRAWGEVQFEASKPIRLPGVTWAPLHLTVLNSRAAWTDEAYGALRKFIEALPQGDARENALGRITRLDCRTKADDLAPCAANGEPPPAATKWRKLLEAAHVDEAIYAKALARRLRELVCSTDPNAIHIMRGVSCYPNFFSHVSHVRYSRLFFAGHEAPALIDDILNGKDCPISAVLTDADKARLQAIRADALKNDSEPPETAKATEPSPAASPPPYRSKRPPKADLRVHPASPRRLDEKAPSMPFGRD